MFTQAELDYLITYSGGSLFQADLYSLLPWVTRAQSMLGSGLTEEGDDESILKKIFYAFEWEYQATSLEIQQLEAALDTDVTPVGLLPYLASLVTAPFSADWSEAKRRYVIKAIAFVWLAKGTHMSWEGLFALHGYTGTTIYELWKSELYETFDYSRTEDYDHLIKSARVDIDTYDNPYGVFVATEVLRGLLYGFMDNVRPIHVLLRPEGESNDLGTDIVSTPCDTAAELPYEDVAWFVSSSTGNIQDDAADLTDSLSLNGTCISWCEAACEIGVCEAGCEAYCEESCAYGSCQSICQTECETDCEAACEYSTCEMSCQVSGQALFGQWFYRISYTIPAASIDADLTDWPMLVHLDEDVYVGAVCNNDGQDLRFAVPGSSTALAYEIESFSIVDAKATGYIWVRVPLVSSTVDTVIYMYAGGEHSPDGENITGVWSSVFDAVYHMDAVATSYYDIQDSTSNGLDCDVEDGDGSLDLAADGQVGVGVEFAGSLNDGVVAVNTAAIEKDLNEAFSGEAWASLVAGGPIQVVMAKYDEVSGEGWRLYYHGTSDRFAWEVITGGAVHRHYFVTTTIYPPGQTVHVAFVTDGAAGHGVYVNGVAATALASGSAGANNPSSNIPFSIGIRSFSTGAGLDAFRGVVDEVRVYNDERPAAWFKANYLNQVDPASFYTVGTPEEFWFL